MKSVRWGLLFVVLAGVLTSAGCRSFPKMISRERFDHLNSIERLNEEQAALIAALTGEKDRLQSRIDALQAQLDALKGKATGAMNEASSKAELLRMQQAALQRAKARIADLEAQISELQGKLTEVKSVVPKNLPEGVTYEETALGGAIRIPGSLLFDSGKAELKKGGKALIKKVAAIDMVKDPNNLVRVCGFSDSDKITHSSWADNFQLSGERARSVLKHLITEGMDASRLHFAGFGPHMLVMENGKENKGKSRRVEIYVIRPQKVSSEVTPK